MNKEASERRRRALREARDLEILNRRSDVLNREVADVLEYQEVPMAAPALPDDSGGPGDDDLL